VKNILENTLGTKETSKKNPKKKEEGTQEDDPFLSPRLKTIGFNLPTIGLTKYLQLWTEVLTNMHLAMHSSSHHIFMPINPFIAIVFPCEDNFHHLIDY
jgi:hypothetical protein